MVASGLMFPTGMTVGPDGAFYVSGTASASAPARARSSGSRSEATFRPGPARGQARGGRLRPLVTGHGVTVPLGSV